MRKSAKSERKSARKNGLQIAETALSNTIYI